MKKTYKTISIVLVVLALLVIVLAGCSDMMAKMGEIVITVEPSDKIRTTVTSYTVTGTLEGSKASPLSLHIVVPATEISIPSISPGKWTFVIKAFDSVGEIGEGTQVVTLSEGQNVNLNVPVDFVPIPLSISNIPFTEPELSKEYDGNTSLTFGQNATYTVDQTTLAGLRKDQGIQDSVILEATATYTDKTAGNGKTLDIVYALIYSQDTAIEGKYTPPAPYTVTNGAITRRQLTITDPSFETKERVYDGTNSLPVTAGSLIGVVDGDEVTVTATAEYDDKKAGTGKDITVTYTLSGSDADNYAKPVDYTTNTGTITQKPLGFSVAAVEKTYDGYAVSSGSITLTGVLNSDTDEVAATGTFTFSDKNAGPDKGVSVEGITLSGAEAGNYILGTTEASTTATISKKPLDNAGTTLLPKVYDQKVYANYHIDYAISGLVTVGGVDDDITLTPNASYKTADAGTGKEITVRYRLTSGSDMGNYSEPADLTYNDGEIMPLPLTEVVPITVEAGKVYDGTDSVTCSGGSLGGILSGDEVTVTPSAKYRDAYAGTHKAITASYALGGPDAANYLAPVPRTVYTGEIKPIQLTGGRPDLSGASKTYNGATSLGTYAVTPEGFLDGDAVAVTATASFVDKNVGSGKAIHVSYALAVPNANYLSPVSYTVDTGEIKQKQLTIDAPTFPNGMDKAYDGEDTLGVSRGALAGVVSGDWITVDAKAAYNDETIADGKTITVTYTIDGPGAGNYLAPVTDSTNRGTITEAKLLISDPILEKTKEYDGTTGCQATAGRILSGIVGTEDVRVLATATYDGPDAGEGKTITVVYSLAGADKDKYEVPGNYEAIGGKIGKRQLSITEPSIPDPSKVYDGTDGVAFTKGAVTGLYASDGVGVAADGRYLTSKSEANKYIKITYSLTGPADKKANYIVPEAYWTKTGEISKRQLFVEGTTVTKEKTYDGALTAQVPSKGTLTGVTSGDSVSLETRAAYSDKNVSTVGKNIHVEYTLSGPDMANYTAPAGYDISDGVSITARQLTAGIPNFIESLSKGYDGNATLPVAVGSLSGIINDEISVSATALYTNADAAEGKSVTVTYSLSNNSGGDMRNYLVPVPHKTNAGVIKARQLTIDSPIFTTSTKVYDGTIAIATFTTGSPIGILVNDTVTIGATASYADKNVGTDKAITVTYTLDGTHARNYLAPVPYTVRTGEIKPIQLTIDLPTFPSTREYDGTTAVDVRAGSLSGYVGGDDVAIKMAVASYADKGVGTGKSITVTYELEGRDAGNYSTPIHNTTTGSITARQLTAGVPNFTGALSKGYDGNTTLPVAVGSLSGIINDEVSVSASALYASADAGVNKVVTVTYELVGTEQDKANYLVPAPHKTNAGVIKARQLTIADPTISDASKTYSGTIVFDKSISLNQSSLSGVVPGDTVTVKVDTASYDDKHVGTNKVVTVSYTLDTPNANYLAPVSYRTTTGAITPLELVIGTPVHALTKSYDGTNTVDVSAGSLSGYATGDDVAIKKAIASYADKGVGTGKSITVTYELGGRDADNYSTPTHSNADGIITAKKLSVQTGLTKIIADKILDLNSDVEVVEAGTLIGVVGDEDVTLRATASYADGAEGTDKVITVVYSLGGRDSANYEAPANNTSFTGKIVGKQLRIGSPTLVKSKTYDNSTDAIAIPSNDVQGIVGSDDVQVVVSSAYYNNKHAGEGKTITVEYALTGTDAGKYSAPATYRSHDGVIGKKVLAIATPAITEKQYDGTKVVYFDTADTVAYFASLVAPGKYAGDEVTLDVSAGYMSSDIATGKLVLYNYVWSGSDAGNYSLPKAGLNRKAVITKKALRVGDNTTIIAPKIYDGNLSSVTTTHGELVGLVSGSEVVALTATGTFATKGVATGKELLVTYSISGSDADKYIAPVSSTIRSGEITQRTLEIAAPSFIDGTGRVYDNTVILNGVSPGSFTNKVDGDVVTVSATASYASADVGDRAITVTYTIGGADASNYIKPADTTGLTGTISKRTLEITNPTFSGGMDRVYDKTDVLDGVSPGSLTNRIDGDVVTVSATASYESADAGDRAITVTYTIGGDDVANYIKPDDTTGRTGTISKRALGITNPTFSGGMDRVYDKTDVLDGVSPGSLTNRIDGDVVTVSATALYASADVGNRAITVTYTIGGADASNYTKPADTTGLTGTISKRALGITNPTFSGGMDRVYDKTDVLDGVSPGSLTNRIDGDVVTVSATASYASADAGDRAITVTYTIGGADASNYTKPDDTTGLTGTISKRALGITNPTFSGGMDRVYDKTDVLDGVIPGSFTNKIDGDDVTVSATASYASADVGDRAITVTYTIDGADASNYTKPADTTGLTGTISKATYDMSGVTFTDASHTYNGKTQALAIGGTLPSGVTVSYSSNNESINAGIYNVTATFSGDSANYELIPSRTAKLTISKAVIDMSGVKYTDRSVTYNGSEQTLLSQNLPSGTYAEFERKVKAGTHVIAVSFHASDSDNYVVSPISTTGTMTINQKIVGLKPTYNSKTYDGTTVAQGSLLVKVEDIVGNDQVTATGTFTFDYADAGPGKQISISNILLGGTDSPNYKLNGAVYSGNNFSIDKKKLNFLSVKATDKTYDGGLNTTGTITLSGKIGSDNVDATGTFTFADANASANPKTVDVKDISLTGAQSHNYYVANTTTTTKAKISPKPLNIVSVLANGKDYDGNVNTTGTITLSGVLASDNVTAKGTFTFLNANVDPSGSQTVSVTDISLIGDVGKVANYALGQTTTSASAKITKVSYDMTGITFTGASHTYDGGMHPLAISGDLPSGVSVSYSSNNESINAGAYNVTATFSGNTTNYKAISDMSARLEIIPAVISGSVSITGEAKVGQDLTADISGLTNTGNPSYKWYRKNQYGADFTVISNANGKTYRVTSSDIGHILKVEVTAQSPNYTGFKTSDATAIIAAIGPPAPSGNIVAYIPELQYEQNIINLTGFTKNTPGLEASVLLDGTNYGDYQSLAVDGRGRARIYRSTNVTTSAKVKIRVAATGSSSAGEDKTTSVIRKSLAIGDYYQGGIVAYLGSFTATGETGTKKGLIVAENNIGAKPWSNGPDVLVGVSDTTGANDKLGAGKNNTTLIIDKLGAIQTNYAAGLAKSCKDGGLSDWFLPSRKELDYVHANAVAIGINTSINENYWTSSESSGLGGNFGSWGPVNYVAARSFALPQEYVDYKITSNKVLPVRYF